MNRQEWLRRRETAPDPVDRQPMEAAVLEPRADTMRDMVTREVNAMVREQNEAELPDDEFLDDEELHREGVESPHQLEALAQQLLDEEEPPPPPPPAEPSASPAEPIENGQPAAAAPASSVSPAAPASPVPA